MVAVGKNPEGIIEEDGKLYLVNSGFGYDNRLSIIDINTFDKAENIEIFQNPEKILEANCLFKVTAAMTITTILIL